MINLHDDWEFNVLGIYNYRKPGPFDALFTFIRNNHDRIPGDLVEAGVYRGNTLLAMGLLLKELGSDKKVYGFDTFSGFPPVYDPKDDLAQFGDLFAAGRISVTHMAAVKRNLSWRQALQTTPVTTSNISSSGQFAGTSLDFVNTKIEIAGLDNIVLVPGQFSETMLQGATAPKSIMAVQMDCDLYASYLDTFRFVWPRLSVGGLVYLDEYFSLKFPGARLATDEFLADKRARLDMAPLKPGDFERWYAVKEA